MRTAGNPIWTSFPRRRWRCGAGIPAQGRRAVYSAVGSGSGTGTPLQHMVVYYATGIGCGDCGIPARGPISGHTAAGGPMSIRDQLNSYIQRLEQRLRLGAMLRRRGVIPYLSRPGGDADPGSHHQRIRFCRMEYHQRASCVAVRDYPGGEFRNCPAAESPEPSSSGAPGGRRLP